MRIVIMEKGVEYQPENKPIVRTAMDVLNVVGDLSVSDTEVFMVLTLDSKNGLHSADVITMGLLDSSLADVRGVYRQAIIKNAAAIILCHNHPSGDLTPSPEDIRVTKQMAEAGRVLDIKLLDHVIVSKGKHLSLREEGLVTFS